MMCPELSCRPTAANTSNRCPISDLLLSKRILHIFAFLDFRFLTGSELSTPLKGLGNEIEFKYMLTEKDTTTVGLNRNLNWFFELLR